MTEGELGLLTLAAKAAGLEVFRGPSGSHQYDYWSMYRKNPKGDFYNGIEWNPLSDDGDAFRLAIDLELDVSLGKNGAVVEFGKLQIEELDASDPYDAVRRAIVRAAAAIGENMEFKL